MAKHRELGFRKFVDSVPPDLLERYFVSLSTQNQPSGWATLNGDELERFLSVPENSELRALVRQDFRRVNDICDRGVSILVDAYTKFKIPFDPEKSSEELALLLFLDHKEAWDFAWARYLLYALDGRVSVFHFEQRELRFGRDRVEGFTRQVKEAFARQAKGAQCGVTVFEDKGQVILYIQRGWYMRTITLWQGEETAILTYRPALEDVIVFEPDSGDLLVKAAQDKERDDYVRAFAFSFAGDPALGEQALKTRTFSLDPIRLETFDYSGNDRIARVGLVGVSIRLPAPKGAVVSVRGANVLDVLSKVEGLSLQSGELVSARFRFYFFGKRRDRTLTFEVAPPSRTDLADTVYTGIINEYLRRQGVRLL